MVLHLRLITVKYICATSENKLNNQRWKKQIKSMQYNHGITIDIINIKDRVEKINKMNNKVKV